MNEPLSNETHYNEHGAEITGLRIFRWDELDTTRWDADQVAAQIVTGEHMHLIRAVYEPGATYEMHSHPYDQFSLLLSGQLLLTVGDETREIGPGDGWYAPSRRAARRQRCSATSRPCSLTSTRRQPRGSSVSSPPADGSVPRIADSELIESLEVAEVSGGNGHVVVEGCRSDECISEGRWVGNMECRCHAGDLGSDGEKPVFEGRAHAAVEPGPKKFALRRVTPFGKEDAVFEFV